MLPTAPKMPRFLLHVYVDCMLMPRVGRRVICASIEVSNVQGLFQEFKARGVEFVTYHSDAMALDLDEPSDLERLTRAV